MRAWPVPVQMTEEEKLVGGVLSLRQLGYLIAGLALGGNFAMHARRLPITGRLLVFLIGLGVGFILAFVQKEDGVPLDVYLQRLFRWWFSSRKLYWRGDD